MSLLSTAIYLGLNPLVKECVGLVLGSVGPWSIRQYLGFAVGEGAGIDDGCQEETGIQGLQGLAHRLPKQEQEQVKNESQEPVFTLEKEVKLEQPMDLEDAGHTSVKQSQTSKVMADVDEPNHSMDDPLAHLPPRFFYGPVGDKIGEACIAWLSRWAIDLLEVEERQFYHKLGTSTNGGGGTASKAARVVTFDPIDPDYLNTARQGAHGMSQSVPNGGVRNRPRSASWQPDLVGVGPHATSIHSRLDPAQSITSHDDSHGTGTTSPSLVIWGHGGLPADVVKTIISSDAFFIANEAERYSFTKRVISLRHAGRELARHERHREKGKSEANDVEGDLGLHGLQIRVKEEHDGEASIDTTFDEEEEMMREEEEEEDAQLNEVFRSGIYYSHMVSGRCSGTR